VEANLALGFEPELKVRTTLKGITDVLLYGIHSEPRFATQLKEHKNKTVLTFIKMKTFQLSIICIA